MTFKKTLLGWGFFCFLFLAPILVWPSASQAAQQINPLDPLNPLNPLNPLTLSPFKNCQQQIKTLIGPQEKLISYWTRTPYMDEQQQVAFSYESFAEKSEVVFKLYVDSSVIVVAESDSSLWKMDQNHCKVQKAPGALETPSSSIELAENVVADADAEPIFKDSDLQQLLKSSPQGLIYLWSPHMPYSYLNLSHIQTVAAQNKLPLKILVDPEADPAELSLVVKKYAIPASMLTPNFSEVLWLQGGRLHFPSTYFYKDGRLAGDQVLGAKSLDAYQFYIDAILKTPLSLSLGLKEKK